WGRFELNQGEICKWRIGPLVVHAHLLKHEWLLAYERSIDSHFVSFEGKARSSAKEMAAAFEQHRYSFSSEQNFLLFTPLLANRDVVSRPEYHFAILPGEKITVYMSTPLWLRIDTGAPQRVLEEVPITVPSDTW